MKNADLREFKDLLLGERFAEQVAPDDWMIKVGKQEVVPVKSAVAFSGGRQVWVKRGPAQEFLVDIKGTLSGAIDVLNSAKAVLDRVIGSGGDTEKAVVLKETGAIEVVTEVAAAPGEKAPQRIQKGWNKTEKKSNAKGN